MGKARLCTIKSAEASTRNVCAKCAADEPADDAGQSHRA
jgi:hypothetical protein